MANINDVANVAGVSITTVSHVVNKTRFVSEELTNKVLDAMEELNFSPNTLARSLRIGKTNTIGLILPDISNQFFSEIARKIEDRGFKYGYSVVLCNSENNTSKEKKYLETLANKQMDGIIHISSTGSEDISQILNELNIPLVLTDRYETPINKDVVYINNYKGGYDATNYLIKLGHKKIGCISGPANITLSKERVRGYTSALEEAGIEVDDSLIRFGNYDSQSGRIAARELLSLPNLITAIFACNDMMALGAMKEIIDREMRIPDDISIVGFDDIPLSQMISPSLTTISQPIEEMATCLIDLLLEKIERKRSTKNNQVFERIILEPKLIKRDSCRNIGENTETE